jgi:cytochrome c
MRKLDTDQYSRSGFDYIAPHHWRGGGAMPPIKSKKVSVATVGLIYAALISGASSQGVSQGGRLAEKYCARCHAIGTADASRHPSSSPFRTIAAKSHVDDLQEALAEGLTVGHPDMPEFQFPPEQIASLPAYLKSITISG